MKQFIIAMVVVVFLAFFYSFISQDKQHYGNEISSDSVSSQIKPEYQYRWSEWSEEKYGLQVRIAAQNIFPKLQHDSIDYYVLCEVRNVGVESVRFPKRGRIFLENEKEETIKTYRISNYDNIKIPTVTLNPGENVIWVQDGILTNQVSSDYENVFVTVDNVGIRSPSLTCRQQKTTPRFAEIEDQEFRAKLDSIPSNLNKISSIIRPSPIFIKENREVRRIALDNHWYLAWLCDIPPGKSVLRWGLEGYPQFFTGVRIVPKDNMPMRVTLLLDHQRMISGVLKEDSGRLAKAGDVFSFSDLEFTSAHKTTQEYWLLWRIRSDINLPLTYSGQFIKDGAPNIAAFYGSYFGDSMEFTK